MKRYFILFFSSLFFFASCEKQEKSINKDPIELTTEQKQLVSSSNKFGFTVFKEIAGNTKEGENVFISPLSMSFALTMLYNGAETATKQELKDALGYTGLTDDQVNIANRDLIKALIEIDPKVAMEIANSIWYKNNFNVEPDFLTINKSYFNAEVEKTDFSPATVGMINNWVSSNTHDKIKKIIEEIPAETVMYLINAIYFKGTWKYQFENKNTTKLDFFPSTGSTFKTDFMVQEGAFEIVNNDLFSGINLPYGNENYSMMVLLPNEGKSVENIISSMNDENWTQWVNKLQVTNKIKIYLPKFKFSFEKKLNDDLYALGMQTMFSNFADLTKISKAGGIKVSEVKHKTFVEVNEEGTEAAAVTSIGIELTSAGPNNIFNANKPFVFIIKEKDTNSLLFMGIMNKPTIEN